MASTGARRRRHLDPDFAAVGRLIQPTVNPEAAIAVSRERFESGLAIPAAVGGHDRDATVLELLRDAEINQVARIVDSSNAVFLVEFDVADPGSSDGSPLRAIYKPARGERPLWDFPNHSLHLREVACYLLDASLGFGVVPATTLRDGPAGPGSMQRFVASQGSDVATAEARDPEADGAAMNARLLAIATLDVLANNADRKRAHLLIDRQRQIWAIDNALSFLPYPRQRTVLIDAGGSALPAACSEAVRALAADPAPLGALCDRLGDLLDGTEVRAFRGRLRELAADPRFPELDPWDGRPFEAW